MADQRSGRFSATWDQLESDVHVPVEDQVTIQAVSPPEPVLPPEELDRQKALGVVGDFRLSR
jgi:hypothetical protein